MQLYSPQILVLSPGQSLQTENGAYTPQVREIWHSHDTYMQAVTRSFQRPPSK